MNRYRFEDWLHDYTAGQPLIYENSDQSITFDACTVRSMLFDAYSAGWQDNDASELRAEASQ